MPSARPPPDIDNPHELSVLVCTFNAGGTAPPADLDPWVPAGGGGYNIIAVGVQECVLRRRFKKKAKDRTNKLGGVTFEEEEDDLEEDLVVLGEDLEEIEREESDNPAHKRKSFFSEASKRFQTKKDTAPEIQPQANETDRRRRLYLVNALCKHLGAGYVPVETVELMAMRLVVLIDIQYQDQVLNIDKAVEATGIGGMVGNKGGVLIKFDVLGTSLCFISCHLAAHEEEKYLQRRNADIREIFAKSKIGNRELDISSQFHHCFVFGDLNYRVDINKKAEQSSRVATALELIENEDFTTLYNADQLRDQMEKKQVLAGFSELQPAFAPTYKVEKLPVIQYQTQRIPSYCDRILWKSLPNRQDTLECSEFTSTPEIESSDHKPVRASFTVRANFVRKTLSILTTPSLSD
jgi:hypothetical protein